MKKVAWFILLELGIVLVFRLVNHFWPLLWVNLAIAVVGSYYIWQKERALDERVRLDRFKEDEQAQHGKH